MVTLDKIVRKVPEFTGLGQKEDYEHAKQASKLIKEEQDKLYETLYAETGFDEFSLPDKKTETEVSRGDITFTVMSYQATKRPQYKKAVEAIENHLKGYQFMLSMGRTITGIALENGMAMIDAGRLLEECEIIVGGVLIPGVTHKVSYETQSQIEVPNMMNLKGRKGYLLSENTFTEFVQMDQLRSSLDTFVEKYEAELQKGGSGVKKVSTKAGYATEKSEAEGADWAYVAKTLLRVRDGEEAGELNILANSHQRISSDNRQTADKYDLVRRTVNDERRVYVSLASVYDRIQHLKNEESITSRRVKITPIDIV